MECKNCGFFVGGMCIVPECTQKGRNIKDLYDLEEEEKDGL